MVGLKLGVFLLALAPLAAQPIRVHPANPHYLEWRGRPFIVVSSGEHYGAVINLDFDWRKYLETLERDGMNYTRLFAGSYREVPGDFGIERNTLAPARFLAPWPEKDGKFNLEEWNPAYFERLRAFAGEAEKRGVAVEVTLFCSTYSGRQWSVSPFHPANNTNRTEVADWKTLYTLSNGNLLALQERFTRKIVRELNPFTNVIFEIQNEPWADRTVTGESMHPYLERRWPNTADLADARSLAWQERAAAWIRSEEAALPNRHLIAWNVCNFRQPLRALLPGADVVNFHYAFPEAALWNYALNAPVSCDETGFLKDKDGEAGYRKQAWRFMLAGGAVFNHLDYSFSVGKEDGTDSQPKSPGGGSPGLRRQFRILRDFLESLPLLQMKPAPEIVKHCGGCTAQALAQPGGAYAVYLTGDGGPDLLLDLPPGAYAFEWLRPADGVSAGSGAAHHPGGVLRLKTPAFDPDIALRLIRSR